MVILSQSPAEEPEEDDEENLSPPPFLSSENPNIHDEMGTPVFSIIPNPNAGSFKIETNFPLSDITHLKITNPLGAMVYETQNLSSNTIQLPALASGHYVVVVVLKDGRVFTEKMVIQR